jgi:hypothetical protein
VALPLSSLAQVCRSVADFVSQQLGASQNHVRVMIGSPSEAAPRQGDQDHRLNLFFYRFEPAGYGAAAGPTEPWLLRMYCLVTAFGVFEDQVSAGENDLRILGEVIRIFHETPVLHALRVEGQSVRAQVVFQPLSVDEINHLWSTQQEVTYRPSVAYELALVPIVPHQLSPGSPLAGALGFEVRTAADRMGPFDGAFIRPLVAARAVATDREDWAPEACLVYQQQCAQSLALAVGSAELNAFSARVWLAGEPGTVVELLWDVWDQNSGWRTLPDPVPATITGSSIDPEAMGSATTISVEMPFRDHSGQAVLYAVRRYTRAADGAALLVRSNPLLLTLYAVAP